MALQAIMIAILHFSELNYQADKSWYYNILETQNPESILQLILLNYETNFNRIYNAHTHRALLGRQRGNGNPSRLIFSGDDYYMHLCLLQKSLSL